MKRILFALLLGLSLAPVLCRAEEPAPDQAKAIAEIEKLGGKVTVDEKIPGKPVIAVNFTGTSTTDADLENVKALSNLRSLDLTCCGRVTDAGIRRLQGLTNLRSLDLTNCFKVTDVGLQRLKGLTNLKTLGLTGTRTTDAGLKHLKLLTNLKSLYLGTAVTDAGLENLTGLTNLKSLYIDSTRVSDDGVKKLQQALPKCTIGLGIDIE